MPRALILFAAWSLHAADPNAVFRAIRDDRLHDIVDVTDARGHSAMHHAASFGSAEAVRKLIALSADVNARNSFGATPLVLASSSPEKVTLLIDAGADVNAATRSGRTALIISAGLHGMTDTVKLLLEKGANIDAADERGITAAHRASWSGELSTLRLLLDRGAKLTPDKSGATELVGPACIVSSDCVRMMLSRGVDVNAGNMFAGKVRNGDIALTRLTALIVASPQSSPDVVRVLLKAGADPNVQDGRGVTPLMAAVATSRDQSAVVRLLLEAGANPNAIDPNGETVLDWALKYGTTPSVKLLVAAGAKQGKRTHAAPPQTRASGEPRQALTRALVLLQRSSTEFFNQSGCVGCHHQPVIARAEQIARAGGLAVPNAAADELTRGMAALNPLEPASLQFADPGGEVDTVGSTLLGFKSAGLGSSSLTDAAVSYIAAKQSADGSWFSAGLARSPIEQSAIVRTALAAKALRDWSWPARQQEFDGRVRRARQYLATAVAENSCEEADRLLGLVWAGATRPEVTRAAQRLISEQRSDGGVGAGEGTPERCLRHGARAARAN